MNQSVHALYLLCLCHEMCSKKWHISLIPSIPSSLWSDPMKLRYRPKQGPTKVICVWLWSSKSVLLCVHVNTNYTLNTHLMAHTLVNLICLKGYDGLSSVFFIKSGELCKKIGKYGRKLLRWWNVYYIFQKCRRWKSQKNTFVGPCIGVWGYSY